VAARRGGPLEFGGEGEVSAGRRRWRRSGRQLTLPPLVCCCTLSWLGRAPSPLPSPHLCSCSSLRASGRPVVFGGVRERERQLSNPPQSRPNAKAAAPRGLRPAELRGAPHLPAEGQIQTPLRGRAPPAMRMAGAATLLDGVESDVLWLGQLLRDLLPMQLMSDAFHNATSVRRAAQALLL
jgi:hypothetical protein